MMRAGDNMPNDSAAPFAPSRVVHAHGEHIRSGIASSTRARYDAALSARRFIIRRSSVAVRAVYARTCVPRCRDIYATRGASARLR